MIQRLFVLGITALAAFMLILRVDGQVNWKLYTAPDKSFSVELPWNPVYQRRDFTKYVMGTPTIFQATDGDFYNLNMYIDESSTYFFIAVFDIPQHHTDQEFDTESDSIMENINGSNKRFIKREAVVFNGLHGRQYVYEKGKLSGVAVLINSGHRIYFIHFYTENSKGIARGPVNRVFTTFEPTP